MESAPTVLLVEDDARLARLVREYLGAQGFDVGVEGRGDTAADRIRRETPDLVVLDLMLPGRDGLDVCRDVRADYRGPTRRSSDLWIRWPDSRSVPTTT